MVSNIEWFGPDRGEGSVEDIVSHLGPTRKAVHKKAISMGREAEVLLAAHHRLGHASIQVDRFRGPNGPGARTPDWYVYLQDMDPGGEWHGAGHSDGIPHRSAMSMEFGWTQTHAFGKKLAKPIPHKGLGILGQVMGRAISRYTGPQ